MATQGPNYAGAAADVTIFPAPGIAWDNDGNATGPPDGVAASCTGPGDSFWLQLTTYGFAVPDGATITDVSVSFRVRDDDGDFPGFYIQLVKGGAGDGNEQDLTGEVTNSFTDVTASGDIVSYWGTTLTPAEANASGFGARCRFEGVGPFNAVYADCASITITYTGGVSGRLVIKARRG